MRHCPNCNLQTEDDCCPSCGTANLPEAEAGEEAPRGWQHTAGRILAGLLFLALMAAVVYGTDGVVNWVKNLF